MGDNTRKENADVEPGKLVEKGVKKDQSSSSSHTDINANMRPSGKLSPPSDSLQQGANSSSHVYQSKKKSKKPQSPPNPFIFPSTFQGSAMDTGVRPSLLQSSTSKATFSEQMQPNSNTGGSPREHVLKQSDAQLAHDIRKQGVVSEISDDDLRPEVAKLPGRKRLASWGTPQENETEPSTGGRQSVKPQPNEDSLPPTGSRSHQQDHRFTNGDHTGGITSPRGLGNTASSNSSVVPTRGHTYNHLSDASSESSSPSESRRSSVTKNRKSWDGVRHPGESEESQKVSCLEIPKDNKERSCSDSNLMVRNVYTIDYQLFFL